MSLRPSGAKLRIANLYRDASGKPTDLDIYGDVDAANAPKLISVPYGTITDFFDPGVQDDQGDADWTSIPPARPAATPGRHADRDAHGYRAHHDGHR